jgi:hypothetical protein
LVCVRAARDGWLAIAVSGASALFAVRAAEMLASQWNPHVLVLPIMAIVVVAAAIAAGRTGLLPVLAALASFIVQTHLGLAPAVVAVSGAATAAVAWRVFRTRSTDSPGVWRIVIGTLGLLLLLWLIPIAQELSATDGNLARLWTFFGTQSQPDQMWRTSFRTWSDMISALVRWDVEVGWGNRYRPNPGPWGQFLAITQSVVVALIAVKAAREKDAFRGALAVMVLMASLVGLWSITRIDDDLYDHLVFWLAGIGALHLGLIADALVRLVPRVPRQMSRTPTVAACVLLFGAAAAVGFQELRVVVSRSYRPSSEPLAARRLVAAILPEFASGGINRPLVTIDQPTWGVAAGVLLQLQKRQIPFTVEEGWWFMFGPPARPAGVPSDSSKLIFAGPELRMRMDVEGGHEMLAERERVAIFVARQGR